MLHQAIPEGLQPWKGPTLEQFLKGWFLWEEPHTETGAAEMKHFGVTTSPVPHPPCCLRGEIEIRSEVEPGKKGGVGEILSSFINLYK